MHHTHKERKGFSEFEICTGFPYRVSFFLQLDFSKFEIVSSDSAQASGLDDSNNHQRYEYYHHNINFLKHSCVCDNNDLISWDNNANI